AALYPFTRAGYIGLNKLGSQLLTTLCRVVSGQVCSLVTSLTAYTSPYQLNETRLPVYLGHLPIGSTAQNFLHYYQVFRTKDFVMYDYGAEGEPPAL
ncbi:hypothetical protein V5799_000313, partial [Amblyomma americanum]